MTIRILFITLFSCLFFTTCAFAQNITIQLTPSQKSKTILKTKYSRTKPSRAILTPRQIRQVKKAAGAQKVSSTVIIYVTKQEAKKGYVIRSIESLTKPRSKTVNPRSRSRR